MIKLENIYIESNDNKYLLNDINIFIPTGSLVSIKGKHSQGKTRIFKTIALLEKPIRGRLIIMGKNVAKLKEREISDIHKKIGVVLEEDLFINNMNVNDNILLPLILRNENRKEINLALKELVPWLSLAKIIKKKISKISNSEKKLVQFARALIARPRILLLDNFFYCIDQNIEKKIVYLIMALNKIGTTVIVFGPEPSSQKIKFNNRYTIKDKNLIEFKV